MAVLLLVRVCARAYVGEEKKTREKKNECRQVGRRVTKNPKKKEKSTREKKNITKKNNDLIPLPFYSVRANSVALSIE